MTPSPPPSAFGASGAAIESSMNEEPRRHRERRKQSSLNTDRFSFVIPTHEDQIVAAHDMHGEASWQMRLLKVLHSRATQFTLMGLLLLDVIILFADLFLLAMFPSCTVIQRLSFSCCPLENVDENQTHLRLLSSSKDDVCEAPLHKTLYPVGCDQHQYHKVHATEEAFFAISITILSIFMVDLLLQMTVLTPSIFFRNAMFVLDFIVISVSIALEVTFYVLEEEAVASLVGLLILARLWRFVRISHGLFEVTTEYEEIKYHHLMGYAALLETRLKANGMNLPAEPKYQRLRQSRSFLEALEEVEREESKPNGGSDHRN